MFLPPDASLWVHVSAFVASAAAIGVAGVKLAGFADRLADRTGLGEALTGGIVLGLVTSLPGIAASVTAALEGAPSLAISNAMGGIAVQTVALAAADIAYPRANLEHAAASAENLLQTSLLVLLISLVPVAIAGPEWTVGHIHPVTFVLFAVAGLGFRMVYQAKNLPMWRPTLTVETVADVPEADSRRHSLTRLVAGLILAGVIAAISGSVAATSAKTIMESTGLAESFVGGFLLAVATSLPELVTSIGAVRRGALALAVGGIVGGNFFDVLFVCAADLAYLPGSLFHAATVGWEEVFVTGLAIILNLVLLVGLIYRQKHGPGNIGFESLSMIVIYVGGIAVLWFGV